MATEETAASWSAYHQAEAQSARTFALVGFVFYLLGAVIGGIALITTLFAVFVPVGMPMGFFFFPVIFPGIFAAISIGLALWSWTTLQNIEAGRYQEAQAPSLVLGILGLFFALLIGGIFLILAYTKLANITSGRAPPVAMAPPPPAAMPQPAGRVCPNCGRPIPMDAKFCNHCGHELP
ncbi:MAG: zinc-ribbon domain-containing protein [Candidatus Thermoplasmatota archaeon]|nr:zinc-ribbon domain-containing protein [Candidatus Thermoplasmatota archaeon]